MRRFFILIIGISLILVALPLTSSIVSTILFITFIGMVFTKVKMVLAI